MAAAHRPGHDRHPPGPHLGAGGVRRGALAFVLPDQHPSHVAFRVDDDELERLAAEHGVAIATHRDATRSIYLPAPAPSRPRSSPTRRGRVSAPTSASRACPCAIEGYELEVLTLELTPEFPRLTTVIHLHGGGEEGVGEDVVYDPVDHEAQRAPARCCPSPASWTHRRLLPPPRRP